MNKESKVELPKEFAEGPWLDGQEVMQWLKITGSCLKGWRKYGIVAFTKMGGKALYNKPWILNQLKNGWTWKNRKKK